MPAACRVAVLFMLLVIIGVSRVLAPWAWSGEVVRHKLSLLYNRTAVDSENATVDQMDRLYYEPVDWGTVRPAANESLKGQGSVVKVADYFYELNWICQKPGTGIIVLAGGRPGQQEGIEYRSEQYEVLRTVLRYEAVGEVEYSDKILWSGLAFGTMTHVGHWVMYVAVPYLVFLKEFVGMQHESSIVMNAIVKEKHGYVYNMTSIFTNYTAPVDVFKPPALTCYKRGYFGFPTSNDPSMSLYFDTHAHIYYQILRERLRHWAGIPPSPRFTTRPTGYIPMVTLTIRTASTGFGRNLTNAAAVKDHLDTSMKGVVRSQIISWNHYPLWKQIEIGRGTDIMVGVHGNNLIWMLVMDPMGAVIELFPYGAEGTAKGLNPAFGKYKGAFYSYIGQRANQTFLTWTASTPNHSPQAPPEEYTGKIFSHRCKRKSSRRWMCLHLAPPPTLVANLVNCTLPYIGRFTGAGYHGEFPFEKEQLARNEPLL
eukprot:TRINITY_DN12221_c0_g1_i1.p1 TRINITY_DN12221_c0_g1~~TRINITY_DN12221_c0_g1_i1.p1  ORF type:complete len:483 (+),score=92.00 TRINITY_DN12221_c0_g1_i1:463-1911(+)